MMQRAWMPVLRVLLLGIFLSACSGPADDDDETLAVVNGQEISVKRFNLTYVDHLIRTGRNDTREERERHLSSLIDTYLLADAARAEGLSDEDLQAYLDLQKKMIVGGRFYEVALSDTLPDPTEEAVRRAYRNSKAEVKTRHLLYRSEEEARAAHARLEAGENFVALANECFETSAFDPMAGYLGVTPYWDVDDAFAEAAFSLSEGAYSEPVRTRYGWHIILVEERWDEPIIAESDYVTRREGAHNRLRQRMRRLAGDAFVRSYMEGLDVRVNVDGVTSLRDAIQIAVERTQPVSWAPGPDGSLPTPRPTFGPGEIDAVTEALSPETPLATYRLRGEDRTFTAADYVSWLPALPRPEVTQRAGASVGRALRNEALAREGLARKLDQDAVVREALAYRSATYLAGRMRQRLQQTELEPTEHELREAYDRLGVGAASAAASADYWIIPFRTSEEASAAQRQISSKERAAEAFDGYERHTDADISGRDELSRHLRRGPLDHPALVGMSDGRWFVLAIENRSAMGADFEDVREQLARTIAPHLPEMRLRRQLIELGEVDVKEDVFEQLIDQRRTASGTADG